MISQGILSVEKIYKVDGYDTPLIELRQSPHARIDFAITFKDLIAVNFGTPKSYPGASLQAWYVLQRDATVSGQELSLVSSSGNSIEHVLSNANLLKRAMADPASDADALELIPDFRERPILITALHLVLHYKNLQMLAAL